MMRLLFISHIFPDGKDPWSGLENVALLHALTDRWDIRAVALRPSGGSGWHPRAADVAFRPEFVAAPALRIFGTSWKIGRTARALRQPLDRLRRDWHFDVVLCASLLPDACAVARLAGEFQFRFVVLALRDESEKQLASAGPRKLVALHLARAAGVVTDSSELGGLLAKSGFRKERMTLVASRENAAEACHRLLVPARD